MRVPAGGEIEVESLPPGVCPRIAKIAQVMDSDQGGTGMEKRNDVGWDEKQIGRVPRHLPREAEVGPEAREG